MTTSDGYILKKDGNIYHKDIKHLASLCKNGINSADQLYEYVKPLLKITDPAYRERVLLLLLENIPKDNRAPYYEALLRSSDITDEMIVSIHQVSKHMIDSDSGLSKVFNDYLVTRFKQGSIKNISEIFDQTTLKDLTVHKLQQDLDDVLHKSFKYLYIDKHNNLHLTLPFARGYNGIMTDSTCKATLELQAATTKEHANCITNELYSFCLGLNKLSKVLPEDTDAYRTYSTLDKQVRAHYKSALLEYLTEDFADKISNIRRFPKEIRSFLGKESNNLYSIVLSPPLEVQDPYLRSVETAVCSFARGKSLTDGMGIKKDPKKDSKFSEQLTSRLTTLTPCKQSTNKDEIKQTVISTRRDTSLVPDERLVQALKNKLTKESEYSNDLERLEGFKTVITNGTLKNAQLFKILTACGKGGMTSTYLGNLKNNRQNTLSELNNIIDEKIDEINESITSNVDINQIADKQMQVITATKYSYMQHMNVSEDEANERFERIFTNEAHIDLTDVDGILNTVLLPEELDPYQPFYTPINDLESEHIIGKNIAENLDIVAQFFIGKLNVYCVAQGLTDRKNNFGKLLDSDENNDLRNNLINVICSCFHQGTSVELGIIGYLNEHENAFGLNKPLQETDSETILQSFTEQYHIIKDFREKDEFYLYEESQSPTVVKYGANVCFSTSECFEIPDSLVGEELIFIDDKISDYDEYQRKLKIAFKELCKDIDNNSLKEQSLYDAFHLSPVDLIKYSLLKIDENNNIWPVVRNLTYLPPACRDACPLYEAIKTCVAEMKINEYYQFIALVGGSLEDTTNKDKMLKTYQDLSSIFPNSIVEYKLKDYSFSHQYYQYLKTTTMLDFISDLKNKANIDTEKDKHKYPYTYKKYKSMLKEFRKTKKTILWIIENDPMVIDSYEDIFNALKQHTRRTNFDKLPNIVQWVIKQIFYFFPGSSKSLNILQTMRNKTENTALRTKIDDYIKSKYDIDPSKEKDNNSPKASP